MNVIEIMRRWPTQESALAHLEQVRWDGKPVCPYCSSDRTCVHASKDKKLPRWQCQHCHRAFSVTVGTIFHNSHLPLQTWFLAIALMFDDKMGISNAQLARDLGLPYKTAWSLAQRIRQAAATDPAQNRLFQSIVGIDEAHIAEPPRKDHMKSDRMPSRRNHSGLRRQSANPTERRGGRL